MGLVTPCSLACLSNPSAETLQHLSLLDHQLGMQDVGSFCLNVVTKQVDYVGFNLEHISPNFPQVPSSHHQSWIVYLIFIPWLWISLI